MCVFGGGSPKEKNDLETEGARITDFYGKEVYVEREGKAIRFQREDTITTNKWFMITRDGKKTEVKPGCLKLKDGDTIVTGKKSVVLMTDGTTSHYGVSFTMLDYCKIKLGIRKNYISSIQIIKGLFIFGINSLFFKGKFTTSFAELKFPNVTNLFYIEARDDASFIGFPGGCMWPIQIINRSSMKKMDMVMGEVSGALIIVNTTGTYCKYYRHLPGGVPPRISEVEKRFGVSSILTIAGGIVNTMTIPSTVDFMEEQKKTDMFEENIKDADSRIRALKEELDEEKNLDEREKIKTELENVEELKRAWIKAEKETRTERERGNKGMSMMQKEMTELFKERESRWNTPLPDYEPITEEDRWTPQRTTRTVKGMDDIMKMVGEQAAALLGAESDEERQRIRDNFKAKQETVIKSMATAASDRYSGVGHLAAYTEKKDLNKSITYKKLNITLQYVEKGPEFQGSDNKPKKDYLLVGLKIYNGTDEQKFFFSERELRLITEKGEETKVRWFKADESYAPKSTYSGFMLFLVPKSEKKFTIQFGEKNKQIVSIQLWL